MVRPSMTAARLAAQGVVVTALLVGAAACMPNARSPLQESCYSDEQCLVAEVARGADAVIEEQRPRLIDDMARLGEFKIARDQVAQLDGIHFSATEAMRSIAVQEIARAAVAEPLKVADLAPIASLRDDPFRWSLDLELVADAILHRSPLGAMDAGLSGVFRPKVVRRGANATLTFILENELPLNNAKLPLAEQEVAWSDVANDWLELGDRARAEGALEKADSARAASPGAASSQVWRTWLACGNYQRAVQATSNLAPDVREYARVEIAEALVRAGAALKARSLLAAASTDLGYGRDNRREGALYGYVKASIHAGDLVSARTAAGQLAALAEKPQLLRAGALTRAAAAYNDLEDHQRSKALLAEAIPLLPGDSPYHGIGGVVGDLGSSMRADTAEQLQRTGDKAMFEAQYQQLSPWWKARLWSDICDPDWPRRPPEAECEKHVGSELSFQRAIGYAITNDNVASSRLLAAAISDFRNAQPREAVIGLLACARLAFAIGRTDELSIALNEAARAADRLTKTGDREMFLADVAALRGELVG
jgi:hypothetical protein